MDDGREKFFISGAMGSLLGIEKTKGLRNAGEHSIENNRKYVLELSENYLKPKFEKWKKDLDDNREIRPVVIRLKGHSRGAVGAGESAMMIRAWVMEKYPDFLPYVKFDLIQFDPVPGTGSASGINAEINYQDSEKGVFTEHGDKFLSLKDSAETSVVYTVLSNYSVGFTPQKVLGEKRIFLTLDTHDVGLQHVDENRNDGHSQVFVDMSSATAYSQSSFNDMPPGVYIVDSQNRVVQIKTKEMAEFLIRRMRTNKKNGKELNGLLDQTARRDVIIDSVRDWFERDQSISEEEKNRVNISLYARQIMEKKGMFEEEKYNQYKEIMDKEKDVNRQMAAATVFYGYVEETLKKKNVKKSRSGTNILTALKNCLYTEIERLAKEMKKSAE